MTPSSLVNISKKDEKEISCLLQSIEKKKEQVEQLTVSIEHLKNEVDLFQHRYNTQVGRYYLELDKVELDTKEYRLRLKLRREEVSEEEIEVRVESCFRENRSRINSAETVIDSEKKKNINELPEQEARMLQNLYRKLAKRFHPDKADDSHEQEKREKLMPLINRAYEEQDLQILERLSIGDTDLDLSSELSLVEKRKRLLSELRCLNRATNELRSDINRVKAGRTYQLKQEVEAAEKNGTDLLSTLAADLKRKVKSGHSHLKQLISLWTR